MSCKIEFLNRARKEILNAWDWYEDKQIDLGDRFLNEVNKKIRQIEKTPERYVELRKPFHETKIDVFPYLIIYRIQERKKIIAISSIFHTSRNPKKSIPVLND